MTDEEWADAWMLAQQRRLDLVKACVAEGSLAPRARQLVHRAKAAHAWVKSRLDAAERGVELGVEAVRTGRAIGDSQLTELGLATAKSSADWEAIEHDHLEAALKVILPTLEKAQRLFEHVPQYSRANPRPGVPPWYYKE